MNTLLSDENEWAHTLPSIFFFYFVFGDFYSTELWNNLLQSSYQYRSQGQTRSSPQR